MLELRESPKSKSRLLLPIIMSCVVHCGISALFLTYVKETMPVPLKIISVEIHTLEPPMERTKPVSVTPAPRPVLPAMPEKIEKQKTMVRAPEQKPAPTYHADSPPVAAAAREAESSSNILPAPTGSASTAREDAPPARAAIPTSQPGSVMPASGMAPVVEIRPDSAYLAALRALIEKRKDYPSTARRGRMEGTVIIGCVMTRSGQLKETRIIRSSGHDFLDNTALRTVRSAGEFPPVPAEIKGDAFRFSCPITYRLINN